jgi:acetylornithine deacetylase/succinyl-diaminopimelate desuccinylase-like protein
LQPATQAKISLRVAPGQDSQVALECLRAHLQAHVPFGAKLTFGETEVGQPYLVDSSGWAAQLMRNSLDMAYDKAPVDMGIGGSIPFIADLTRVFPAAQILITGVEDPDSRAHSPNESLNIDMLRRTTLAQALFLAAANARQ